MTILIAYLLGIMSAIIPRNVEGKTIKGKTEDEGTKPEPSDHLQRISAEIDLSEGEAHRYYHEQDKSYSLQNRIFCVNLVTLIAFAPGGAAGLP